MKRIIPFAAVIGLMATACTAQSVSGSKSVGLTVYNAGFALVKDTRTIALKKGVNSIEVADVAAQIDPTSVLFKSLTAPNSVAVLEQNYQYDLISPDSILKKMVGERVWFNNGEESGILLNPPDSGAYVAYGQPSQSYGSGSPYYSRPYEQRLPVIQKDDGRLVMDAKVSGVSELPDGLKATPTLNWLLESDRAGAQDSEISYITNGIGWKADYVALVNKNDTALDLTGWVTLNNTSGATYKDANLTLMAGDVRIVPTTWGTLSDTKRYARASSVSTEPQFKEKSFFEYHMYSMARPTTIANNETKQLSLLSASSAQVKKEMIYDARGTWFRSWWVPGRGSYDPGSSYDTSNYHKVNVILILTNSRENHMGMPLPKGKVRVYKLDDTGSQQFVGEDQIDHTPKDEKVRLYVGDAFDVVGDYKRTRYTKIDDNTVEESFEVVMRNHKDSAVSVKIVDHVWSDWKVTEKSHDYTKKDASTIEFPVKVPANGNVKITYTIRTRW